MKTGAMDIRIELGTFFSRKDEARFFAGLRAVRGVNRVLGQGTFLLVELEPKAMDRDGAIELLALLRRYGLSRKPLKPLSTLGSFAWMKKGDWARILADRLP